MLATICFSASSIRSVPRFSLCEEFQDLERPIGAYTKCRFPGLFHCGACRLEFRCFRPCGRSYRCKVRVGDRVKSLAELSGGGLSGNEEVSKLAGGSYEHTMNAASAAPAKKQEKASSGYTMEAVAKHTKKGDVWVVLHGRVLNVSNFFSHHPGSELAILTFAGKDATAEFDMIHPPYVVKKYVPDSVSVLLIETHGAVANFELPKGDFFCVVTVTFVFNRQFLVSSNGVGSPTSALLAESRQFAEKVRNCTFLFWWTLDVKVETDPRLKRATEGRRPKDRS